MRGGAAVVRAREAEALYSWCDMRGCARAALLRAGYVTSRLMSYGCQYFAAEFCLHAGIMPAVDMMLIFVTRVTVALPRCRHYAVTFTLRHFAADYAASHAVILPLHAPYRCRHAMFDAADALFFCHMLTPLIFFERVLSCCFSLCYACFFVTCRSFRLLAPCQPRCFRCTATPPRRLFTMPPLSLALLFAAG